MSWFNVHSLYNSMAKARSLVDQIDNDLDDLRLRMMTGSWKKPVEPEEYLRRCLIAGYHFAKKDNISDTSFIEGCKYLVQYIRDRQVHKVECRIIEEKEEKIDETEEDVQRDNTTSS